MPLQSIDQGTKLTDGTEQTLFADVAENLIYNLVKIYMDLMVANDILVIRIYDWDIVAGAFKIFDTLTYYDAQTGQVTFYLPPLPGHRCKVTIQRTGGADHNYNWERLSN